MPVGECEETHSRFGVIGTMRPLIGTVGEVTCANNPIEVHGWSWAADDLKLIKSVEEKEKEEKEKKSMENKFKVGDTIIANEKASGHYVITINGWIGVVKEVCDDIYIEVAGKGIDGSTRVQSKCFDLYTPKYKYVKSINGAALLESGACSAALDEIVKKYGEKYGFYNYVPAEDFDEIMEYVETKEGWIEFLIDEGFIEEIKEPEETYKRGDCFKYTDIYMLVSGVDYNNLHLVNLRDGNGWTYTCTKVKNINKVTEEEMQKITSGQFDMFKKVPNPFKDEE